MKLYVAEYGEGKPLVLLHGNGESGGYFKKQIACFRRFYRVIAVDTRGHGQSPRGTAPFTLDQFAEDLKEFLDGKGLKRICLLGFSDGGNIALLFALKYPEYVEKLILNGANLYPLGLKLPVLAAIVREYMAQSLRCLGLPGRTSRKKELLGLMVKEPHIRPKDLRMLSMPVLVIAGTQDMIRKRHTRLIAASLPHGRLCLVKGDHFVAAKNSRAFNRAVYRFLK